jgi:polyferredoxin
MRPRVIVYAVLLTTIISAVVISLALRQPFKADVIRDRASLVRETNDGLLENAYSIRIMNVSERDQHFRIAVEGLPDIKIQSDSPVITVKATETETTGVRVQVDPQYASRGGHEIHFIIQSQDDPAVRRVEKSSFIGE